MAGAESREAIARQISLDHAVLRDLSPAPGVDGGFRAYGDDAQFELRRTYGRALRAGIYRLEISVRVVHGHLEGPAIYPAFRGVYSEATRIDLPPPDASGRIVATLRLERPVRRLRFDPSCAPCTFVYAGTTVRRIGGAPAVGWRLALEQLRAHARERGWRDALEHACTVLRQGGLRLRLGAGNAAAADPLAVASLGYAAWVEQFDRLDAKARSEIVAQVAKLTRRPLISVLLPVFDPPQQLLRRCIESVRAQLYPHWELCIADDASTDPDVAKVLAEYANDARIRVVHRGENGHIVRASNTALEMARGEFVALLDHDDELAEQALFRVAERIVEQSDVAFLYSDEDKIDAQGRRFEPYFKPEWDPLLLRSQNYANHLSVFRTALVRELGGFRVGFEGAQDYDLVLRCCERLQSRQIAHLPEVLYHWRAIPGSTALAGSEKNYAATAGLRALEEHLQRSGTDASAGFASAGHYRVRYRLPQPAPRVCLVIPTRDRVDLLSRCVDSLLEKTRYPDYEILIVDNGSCESETLRYFERVTRSDARVRVLRCDIPFNYSALNNFGVEQTTAEMVGLLNNDLEVIHADWLEEMTSQAVQPGIGAVGAMLIYPNDRIQHAGVVVGLGGVAGHAYKGCARDYAGQMNRARLCQSLSAVTAACLLVRRQAYLEVGGFDPELQVAFNDVDFCLRMLKAGYRNVWTPFSALYHWESASRGYEDSPHKQARFAKEVAFMQRRWGESLQHDPAYNRNLSLNGDAYTLAWPPRRGTSSWPGV